MITVAASDSGDGLTGRVALGGAGLSLPDVRDDAASVRTIRAAADAGIRIFDSARAYAPVDDPTHNERLFALAVAGRTEITIATKGGHFRTGAKSWAVDNSPERLRADVLGSLHALGAERLALFYLHRADETNVPTLESMEALEALRAEGLIERIGISNTSTEQLSLLKGHCRIDAVQNRHDLLRPDTAVLDWCERNGAAFFAYSPLGGSGGAAGLAVTFPKTAALARERSVSISRLILAALLASSPALSVVSGATRIQTAIDSAAAESLQWDEECAAAVEADLR